MNWDEYFMSMAKAAALKSKDSTQVGAVLVDPEGAITMTAFNGPPRGVHDSPSRFERPQKYLYASHAETNLIAFAARRGVPTLGSKVYCTHFPCAACTRTMIQAGVQEVIYADGTFQALAAEKDAAQEMMREASVWYRAFDGKA